MNALSLFSGAGGMDIGLTQAGFDILACVEIDPHACDTLRHAVSRENRQTKVIQADIRTINPDDLLESLGLVPGELDLLCGGPPCQAFSQIGKQNSLEDERGMLLFEMVRFAAVFQPKAIIIEQVKGLLSARDEQGVRGGVLERLINELVSLGYDVQYRTLLAADYGVPQLRERVFIVAGFGDNFDFVFPEPTYRHPTKATLLDFHLPSHRTVGDVLYGLVQPTPKSGEVDVTNNHIDVTPQGDRRRIKGVPEGAWLSSQRHLPAEQLCNLGKKDTTKFRRLSNQEPSLTLRCGEIFFHPTEDRILTPKEYMRIHCYPDDYILYGPIRSRSGRVRHLDQHRQIANSVPPPVAKAVAESVIKALECQKYTKSTAIA